MSENIHQNSSLHNFVSSLIFPQVAVIIALKIHYNIKTQLYFTFSWYKKGWTMKKALPPIKGIYEYVLIIVCSQPIFRWIKTAIYAFISQHHATILECNEWKQPWTSTCLPLFIGWSSQKYMIYQNCLLFFTLKP